MNERHPTHAKTVACVEGGRGTQMLPWAKRQALPMHLPHIEARFTQFASTQQTQHFSQSTQYERGSMQMSAACDEAQVGGGGGGREGGGGEGKASDGQKEGGRDGGWPQSLHHRSSVPGGQGRVAFAPSFCA